MENGKNKVNFNSANINEERLAQLRQLFPEAFTEGKVDFDKLRATLGDLVDDRPERYSFTWAGKQDAIRILQTPTSATLIPAPDESVDFNNTQNIFIEGDNLEVLKLLYKAYFGRVKMIYIDPPYNTGNDFIYPDNYADPLDTYLQLTGQKDAEGNLLTTNSDTFGRYHSTWLTMMYSRLFIARQLLRDDGVIFISIDDNEVHNLRFLLNELFGEENFIASLIWKKMDSPSRNDADRAVTDYHDYILVYAKSKNSAKLNPRPKKEILEGYTIPLPNGQMARRRQLRKNGKGARREDRPTLWFPLKAPDGNEVWPIAPEGWDGRWVLSKETWLEREADGLTQWIERDYGWVPYYLEVAPDNPSVPWSTIWTEVDQNRQAKAKFTQIMGSEINFENPKPTNLLEDILRLATEKNSICMDFFAGSGSLAQAVLELNRSENKNCKFVLVQLPEPTTTKNLGTIAEIAKERIRRVIQQMKAEDEGKLPLQTRETPEDLGFKVFKLAPTNFRSWEGTAEATPEEFASQMELFTDPLIDGWRPANVIYEIALKEGYSLNCYIQRTAVAGHEVYRVNDQEKEQHFYLCLENAITENLPAKLSLTPDDLFVCRDIALNDTMAANLALQCRLKTI